MRKETDLHSNSYMQQRSQQFLWGFHAKWDSAFTFPAVIMSFRVTQHDGQTRQHCELYICRVGWPSLAIAADASVIMLPLLHLPSLKLPQLNISVPSIYIKVSLSFPAILVFTYASVWYDPPNLYLNSLGIFSPMQQEISIYTTFYFNPIFIFPLTIILI